MTEVQCARSLQDTSYDGVVVITDNPDSLQEEFICLGNAIKEHQKIDKSQTEIAVLNCPFLPAGRVIYAPTGPVSRDYDDVRRFQETAVKAMKRALDAGVRKPLVIGPSHDRYPFCSRVTFLGALSALYVPLEIREACADRATKADVVGLLPVSGSLDKEMLILKALESGRAVYRDIGGSDPERSAPPRVADYVTQLFEGTCVAVRVISDVSVLEDQYPLMAAVNRASRNVPRHGARLIFLDYEGEGPIDQTLMLVGKGITYDTGGADLKVGGAMVGMSRDKCGSAFVAGFFKMLTMYKPKGLKVVGAMCMSRNSIGSECYVSDEIITSRAGVRVRIGNTDAEGRMVMGDVLCKMKEQAANEVNPQIFTIATLTGHVIRVYGKNYSAAVENGPARKAGIGRALQDAGENVADPFELSTLRREDYDFHRGVSEYEDVIQANNQPSTMTNRGHQTAAAFLNMASGLDKCGLDSDQALPYTHFDIAGSSGTFPFPPTGAPLVAFSHVYVLNRPSGQA